MPTQSINNDKILFQRINHPVLFIDTARPQTTFVAFQWFGFTNAFKRGAPTFFDEPHYAQTSLAIFFKPVGQFVHGIAMKSHVAHSYFFL